MRRPGTPSPRRHAAPRAPRPIAAHRWLPLLALLALLALPACREDRPPAPTAAAPTAAEPATPAPTAAPPGALARTPPPPTLPADPTLAPALAAVERHPTAATWVELGRAWVRTARRAQREALYDQVDDAARAALALDPKSAQARHLRGLVLTTRHRFTELRALAEQLTRDDPADDAAWALLADAALALGDHTTTERALDRLLDLRPALPAYARAAWLRWLHGDIDGSLQMWTEALRAAGHQDPEPRAWTLTEAGHVEWNRGRLDAAARLYAAALTHLPDHAGALFGRARVHLARGDARAAATDLAASAAARPAEITLEWQALALRAAGDTTAADALDHKLAQAGPFDDDRTIALYLAHRRLDPARAVERARRDFQVRQDLYAHDALGFALYRAGQLDDAARHLEAATRYGTPDPMLHAHRGLIAAARGRHDEAREHLDRAWAQNPHAHPLLMAEVAAARAALPAPATR